MSGKNRSAPAITSHPLREPLLRGANRPRVALTGRLGVGKSTLFAAASSPVVRHERLAGIGGAYQECRVDIGLDQIELVDLPPIDSILHPDEHDHTVLKYLLWGDRWPEIARHDSFSPGADFTAPDVLIQVVDATTLERDLQLSLELCLFGRPLVIALNKVDEARRKGLYINVRELSLRLGVPVVPTIAHMGKGITALFEAALEVVRNNTCPLPQAPARHIADSLQQLKSLISRPEIESIFQVPRALLLTKLAVHDEFFINALEAHSPGLAPEMTAATRSAEQALPRPLPDELRADRLHRASTLFDAVTRPRGTDSGEGWRRWLDELFLHPRWGLLGSLLVFALVLLIVFEVSAVLDSLTSARLADWVRQWPAETTPEVVGRAVAEGLVGLTGIVIPYMLPLVLLLVTLEESGIMHRVAFVVDRGFHRIGLHGGVAVPFLIGLGCNVPAISAAASSGTRREKLVSAILITFVPCSARSAIILAIGGKYLGGLGVLAIFMLTLIVIAVLGRLLASHFSDRTPGLIQTIPPYALPRWKGIALKTWDRTKDIVTIVTPLLIAGSVVLALLGHYQADAWINEALTPVTRWWLGLPPELGVPILFGILRKELSLLMIYQALGTLEIAPLLDHVQIFTFLVFLTFYVPCLSTFAVMVKTLGRRQAWLSVLISLACALLLSGTVRMALELARRIPL